MPPMSDEPDDTATKLAAALDKIAALEARLEHEKYARALVERDLDATIRNPPTPREEEQHKALLLVANKRIRAMAQRALEGIRYDREAPTVGLVHRLCQTLAELRGPAQERETKLLDIVAASLGSWPHMNAGAAIDDLADALGLTIQYSQDGDHARIDPATLPRWYVNAYEPPEGIGWG